MNKSLMYLIGLAVVAALTLAATCQQSGKATSEQPNGTDYRSQMAEYEQQGRYDEAVGIGLKALTNTPRDAAVYDQIAMIYVIRARKDAASRERWASEAITYSDKAVSAEDDNPVNLLDGARIFQMAGDLSSANRCSYYGRAAALSERLNEVLQRDHVTIGGQRYPVDPVTKAFVAYGKTFHIQPLADENKKILALAHSKFAEARCGLAGGPDKR